MTSEEGNLQLAQSYSPYGEELEEIGSEPVTFGYAGQLYDEQTGLLFLRARYYSPSNGRFISHDSWAGDAYMPMSYNMWLYGYGNPMRYTDPSGNFAILAAALPGLVGGTVGFLSGATIGGIVGACFYDMALTGQCGCAMKQEAFATSRSDWVLKNMMGGALVGGLLGAVAAYGPAGLLIASGIGLIGSAKDLIETVQIVNNETGWTTCTIARAVLDVAGIVLSIAGGVTALRNWKATGGKWTWKPISKEEPTIKVDSHHNMKNDPDIPGQSHHLNQAAAYDTVIPHEEGVAIKLEGNILKDVDSPHYNAHKSLEGFWDQYRTSAGDFYGETPTNGKYNRALYDSLIEAGLSHVDAAYAVLEAYKQQLSYGLKNWHNVPRIPRKIYINWQ